VVEDYQVLNAASYGVPQDRHRLFLLGARIGLPLPQYPVPTHKPAQPRNGKPPSLFLDPTPTVWDAIRDLPEADDFDELLERD
jgi:DNA (cytosine-5)-methyltransferase 1